NYSKTVYEELSDATDSMSSGEIRNLLGAMLFSGDDVQKRVSVLSGGERGRLAMSKVLAHRNNTLLLDEPTNNLDIVAKDTLLDALRRFPGTVVIVSHDRYLLNELATEVIEVGRGHATRYLGNYDYYLAKKAAAEAAATAANGAAARAAASAAAAGRAAAPAGISERPGNGRRPRAPRDAASSGHGKAAADEAASRQSEVKQRRESERRAPP